MMNIKKDDHSTINKHDNKKKDDWGFDDDFDDNNKNNKVDTLNNKSMYIFI